MAVPDKPRATAASGYAFSIARRAIIALLLASPALIHTPCFAQAENKAEANLQSLKDSFERNVDGEVSCRKDLVTTAHDADGERWIAELKTCLGSFGIQLRRTMELNRRLDDTNQGIDQIRSKLSSCGKAAPDAPGGKPQEPGSIQALERDVDECLTAMVKRPELQPVATLNPGGKPQVASQPAPSPLVTPPPASPGTTPTAVPAKPEFYFAGPQLGAMRTIDVQRHRMEGSGQVLAVGQCAAALDWLLHQGDWLFPRIWAFEGTSLRLCVRTPKGDEVIEPPEWNTEAHAVVLR